MTEFQKWNSSLRKGGFEVITTKVAQEQVANFVNKKRRRCSCTKRNQGT
jgi:hypothetical protein